MAGRQVSDVGFPVRMLDIDADEGLSGAAA
ncbi:hypothetical protein ARNL5_00559 [Anaerolineae bacterium]|nr:hypothetical protein ARNL5_00559 [Anaerolineae bacterium]